MNKTIESKRKVGDNYFKFVYSRRSDRKLDYYLDQFNFDDYWCFKKTRHQKLIGYDDFLNFNHSGYTLFRKNIYSKESIQEWIDWMIPMGGIQYLSKPTPPFPPTKVKIIK